MGKGKDKEKMKSAKKGATALVETVKNAQTKRTTRHDLRSLEKMVAEEVKATVCDEDHPWFALFVRYKMHVPDGKMNQDFYTWGSNNPHLLE